MPLAQFIQIQLMNEMRVATVMHNWSTRYDYYTILQMIIFSFDWHPEL